jgi:urea transport system permease protein
VPESSPLHLSSYVLMLVGKYMCYAILALAVDLVWGYAGILSLGQAAFFALGGYAMGMYLMRQIGTARRLRPSGPAGLHGVSQLGPLPWFWFGFDRSGSPR